MTGKHPVLNFVPDPPGWKVNVPPESMVLYGSRLVLIVHGYNNDEDEAAHSYDILFESLRELVPNPDVLRSVWEVYWPGYVNISGKKRTALSAFSYPAQVRKAVRIGRALGSFLNSVAVGRESMEVLFVAHSLGCRVVLETIRNLSTANVSVKAICLMAAAVPVTHVSSAGALRPAADAAEKRYILHSPADTVLKRYFRAGQLGDSWSEAVGRFGNPRSYWDVRLSNNVNTGLDHGEYYTGKPKRDALGPSRTHPIISRLLGRPLPMYPRSNDPYTVTWTPPENLIGENKIRSNRI
ncbi:MAG TPA: alpha/beta hydrolase [Bryobacteraceae bacterium]|nr:alpha/beta hydrolase [Bryobacteraceae bacterium]